MYWCIGVSIRPCSGISSTCISSSSVHLLHVIVVVVLVVVVVVVVVPVWSSFAHGSAVLFLCVIRRG